MSTKNNIEKFFELKPVKPGKISEISEATAASFVPPAERVNFHIGNPVQDERLTFYYLRTVLKLQSKNEENFSSGSLLKELDWLPEHERRIKFLHTLIKNSAPYSPRGGYSIKNPVPLIKKFHKWINEEQEEPLLYDTGEKSGNREIVISSGGVNESLRILFHSLNSYLANLPAKIFLYGWAFIPQSDFSSLNFSQLPESESDAFEELNNYLQKQNNEPVYLLLGKIFSEDIRRKLRNICLERPLFFIEVNDAPNHLSLAREAKLKNRVLRIITPGFISSKLKDSSIVFAAGIHELLKIFESVHFQLKGTPSASEIELLQYLIDNADEIEKISDKQFHDSDEEPDVNYPSLFPQTAVYKSLQAAENAAKIYQQKIEKLLTSVENFSGKIAGSNFHELISTDYFANKDANEILDEFFSNIDNPKWNDEAIKSFAGVFAKAHPEYSIKNLEVASGSSRTALALLGFHCGISEVVTCDYSWTYEHCFPKSTFVPLTDEFELDVDGIITAAESKINNGSAKQNVAVVINNPHNASGKIFREKDLKNLLTRTLNKNILVIDDLAYQNVLPEDSLKGPKTVKQLALDLIREGKIYKEQLENVITVHSLSKTDCFAGARLAVVDISNKKLAEKFHKLNSAIKPNIAAILTAYLFYRNDEGCINKFWLLRNRIFKAKMKALEEASAELPEARNQFKIFISRPQGSMYPRMMIENLPDGLSLDWLSSGLAAQGIGLVPLSAFARTSKGFELARKSFRLTLGGTDTPEILLRKTRRVLIDLNRLVAEEKAKYNKQTFAVKTIGRKNNFYFDSAVSLKNSFFDELKELCIKNAPALMKNFSDEADEKILSQRFVNKYLPERLETFKQIFEDRLDLSLDYLSLINSEGSKILQTQLEFELYKDNLADRSEAFRKRTFDRTVHPTQLFAIDADILFNAAFDKILRNEKPSGKLIYNLCENLIEEYLGKNVAINSAKEGEELVCDLRSIIGAEQFSSLYSKEPNQTLLSFWGDWDGSNRPSGQGHRLVAAALIENVNSLSGIIKSILSIDKSVHVDPLLIDEINQLGSTNKNFWDLLNHITSLTNQLEKRYKSVLPFNVESNRWRKLGMKLGVAQDPIIKLWQHNDSLEQKMFEMRSERRKKLEYYFRFNKDLRKALNSLIPFILKHSSHPKLMLKAGFYRDVLKRFALTPRIHQRLITAKDQFSINTTVHNIFEINTLSGTYGNPGMVMGLQVSMSTNAEALISLDKKFVSEREKVLRNNADVIPKVWSIPLFEDLKTVSKIEEYLDKIWDYAVHSRSIDQEAKDRFSEIMCEVFIAGSDLSQQVGQTASALLYNTAKHKTIEWLAKKGLVDKVRIKLGSGEPMQRQGGYYADFSSKPAFIKNEVNKKRFEEYLKDSTIKSTEFAVSPLHGVFAGGDLRTLQSAVSEKLRYLSTESRAQLLYHLKKTQDFYHSELIRAAEPFIDTRLVYESKSLKELERLTLGKNDEVYLAFSELTKKNFQQIIYGSEDDVVGIHIISYFLSRATPVLRDRPVERPSRSNGDNKGQKILERIASTIPLCKHGSLLRAISHNKAQTFILGVNQLTTGLFRALNQFSQMEFVGGNGYQLLHERILPHLPVYEILQTTRIFQDKELIHLNKFSNSFPAGITAFTLLREDMDSMEIFIPLLQKELLRRHGINVSEFFKGDNFIYELLPTLRPDLAVLIQPDLFNTDRQNVVKEIKYEIPADWLEEFSALLDVPGKINYWRNLTWKLLEEPIKNQVKSFVELAIALNTLSKDIDTREFTSAAASVKKTKFETSLADLLKGKVDDSMREFLTAAVQYLTRLPAEMVEVPIDIVRALKDVERILRIEEQALSKKKQELLNFYLLQIARHVGDNG
ncbi:MAG: aminotransferase class I/II-fold pyridoxal phosphate-dependent enzyme [Ignavibacteriales bacterium]|nr:aminotransferase class I/II-fold pyridoxal phosphate-dependent enzyme [Ignavibacteriales bacterium]